VVKGVVKFTTMIFVTLTFVGKGLVVLFLNLLVIVFYSRNRCGKIRIIMTIVCEILEYCGDLNLGSDDV